MRIEDNNLYMLSIGKRKHSWSIVKTTGPQPKSRFQHSMHFLRESNMMIMVGGRLIGEKTASLDAEFIQDTHVLNVKTLEWSILQFTGPKIPAMYNFSSCLSDDKDLYIFGGCEEPLN